MKAGGLSCVRSEQDAMRLEEQVVRVSICTPILMKQIKISGDSV